MTENGRRPDLVEEMEQVEADVAPGREAGAEAPPTESVAEGRRL
jgi:hypothetical protein